MKFGITKFTRTGLERRLGYLFLFLLFPGFFFYHTAIALGVIPPFLGGFFSPVSVVVVSSLLPLVIWGMLRRKEFFNIDRVFWLIILYWCITLISYQSFSSHFDSTKAEVLDWSLRGILANIACYAVGRSLNIESSGLMRILIASLIGMLLISITNATDGLFYLRAMAGDEESVATYQGFARSALVVSVLALLVDRRFSRASIVFVCSLVLLFLNGARSEFVFFLAAGLVFWWFVVFKSTAARLLSVLAMLPLAIIVLVDIKELTSLLPQTRMIQLLDIMHSSSGESRMVLSNEAVNIIREHPLFGSYAAYVPKDGIGGYAHNILSAWADLGIFGFLLFIFGLFFLLKGGRKLIAIKYSYKDVAIYMFAVILLIAYLAAKDYTYMIFGFTAGLYAKALSRQKMLKNKLIMNSPGSIERVVLKSGAWR